MGLDFRVGYSLNCKIDLSQTRRDAQHKVLKSQMNGHAQRYSDLAPFSIEEKVNLCLLACHFFSPLANGDMSDLLGKPKHEGRIVPLDGGDFIQYLEKSGKLISANRRMYRIAELLRDLAFAHILTDMGPGKGVVMGAHYYFMKELTAKQKTGPCWFAPALGGEFIYSIFGPAALHITGVDSSGDVVAGTGIAINENWILTCAHVLNDMKVDQVQNFGGVRCEVSELHSHPEIDIGLMRVDGKLTPVAGLSFSNPVAGVNLYTVGYPRIPMSLTAVPIMHRGEVTVPSLKTLHGHNLFLFSAIARPGNSGGPIVGECGTVVGLVTQELYEDSSRSGLPFYAGVPTTEIVRAIKDICPMVELPVEDYA